MKITNLNPPPGSMPPSGPTSNQPPDMLLFNRLSTISRPMSPGSSAGQRCAIEGFSSIEQGDLRVGTALMSAARGLAFRK